ncbi:Uncharacterised protein [Vibrio cholerae]|nr:Uncharacterised protein [Vibrio cholerae]
MQSQGEPQLEHAEFHQDVDPLRGQIPPDQAVSCRLNGWHHVPIQKRFHHKQTSLGLQHLYHGCLV